ncbi:hypothetical protein BAUCODRAFT_149825 [Baudoinia panamericana UAMH 10762]|uniref:Uncharacterized protein n=1 Tax=Baudoinia panamericana (strain UAMH 10762) TaxID=717646 RepID=M2LKC4_BAUPA|nr:uncharacterized protein BAUCODRAFT_149825 [Baudoinia panamericana UAMH 10762]EMC94717.1 hypothetical protein BAUCODRAFT_149825 [Baudoinia panamericana UAMH 10762]
MANRGGMSNHVSVFHFTSRISNAKIRKYKIATERGMAGVDVPSPGSLSTPAPQTAPMGPLPSTTGQSSSPPAQPFQQTLDLGPPAKKLKLRLPARESEPSPVGMTKDGVVVARAEPGVLRMRYSDNMVLDDESLRINWEDDDELVLAKPAPRAPTVRLPTHFEQIPVPVKKEPTPSPTNPDYGDFMSYYVMDGDDDKPKAAPVQPPPTNGHAQPNGPPHAQQRQPAVMQHHGGQPMHPHFHGPMPPQNDPQFGHPAPHQNPGHVQPRHPPPVSRLPPRPAPPPPPRIELVDFDCIGRVHGSQEPITVAEMIKKLEALSAALATFGGVPAPPGLSGKQPSHQNVAQGKPSGKQKNGRPTSKDGIDDLLGYMSSGAESNEEEGPSCNEADALNYVLDKSGKPDDQLIYGIQFIQNALRSWAGQRIHAQVMANHQHTGMYVPQQQQGGKRGPGRPRKFNDEEYHRMMMQAQPQVIRIHAQSCTEGQAVQAFQQVLDSGCLQVNAVLPQELIRALQNLYMQIDHLINQGSKNAPHWQCMSYGAQIAANRVRVEKWKEAQAKAQEEMARQQDLSHQQVLQGMGLPVQTPQPMSAAQAQHAHAMELERRRSVQHAAQQPYLSQHHLNPLLLGSQPIGIPNGFAVLPSPSHTRPGDSPAWRSSHPGTPIAQNGFPNPSRPGSGHGEYPQPPNQNGMMYMPGLTSRSGQQMKFSFVPENAQAIQVFGTNAFPTGAPPGPNIPNRGPMSATPVQRPPHHGPAAVTAPIAAETPAVVDSIETPAGQINREAFRKNGTAHRDVEMTGTKDTSVDDADTIVVKQEVKSPAPAAPPIAAPAPSFTAINAPSASSASALNDTAAMSPTLVVGTKA